MERQFVVFIRFNEGYTQEELENFVRETFPKENILAIGEDFADIRWRLTDEDAGPHDIEDGMYEPTTTGFIESYRYRELLP